MRKYTHGVYGPVVLYKEEQKNGFISKSIDFRENFVFFFSFFTIFILTQKPIKIEIHDFINFWNLYICFSCHYPMALWNTNQMADILMVMYRILWKLLRLLKSDFRGPTDNFKELKNLLQKKTSLYHLKNILFSHARRL